MSWEHLEAPEYSLEARRATTREGGREKKVIYMTLKKMLEPLTANRKYWGVINVNVKLPAGVSRRQENWFLVVIS